MTIDNRIGGSKQPHYLQADPSGCRIGDDGDLHGATRAEAVGDQGGGGDLQHGVMRAEAEGGLRGGDLHDTHTHTNTSSPTPSTSFFPDWNSSFSSRLISSRDAVSEAREMLYGGWGGNA